MNTKGILICLLLFVVMFSVVGAATQDAETKGIIQITEAKQVNGALEIGGTITNACKGMRLGLLVYNPQGEIEYVNQLTLTSADKNGETEYSFPALYTDMQFENCTAVVRADGYGKAQKTIDAVESLSFYVSPQGSDFNKGTFESPFASVEAAKNAVRRLKSSNGGLLPADVTVYLRGGVYPIYQTISFTEEDSGTNGHVVTYCAYRDEVPHLVGTKRIFNKWTKGENGVWISTTTPMGNYDMQSLSDGNGMVGISARFPDEGYLSAKKVYNPSNSNGSLSSFAIRTEDNVPEISDTSSLFVSIWPNGPGWHNWENRVESVKSIESGSDGRIVNFYGDISSTAINNGARYYLRGAEEFLNQPGEFYYNRTTGTLKFIPPNGFEMTETTPIYASSAVSVLKFEGKYGDGQDGRVADGKPVEVVENIVISGLDISGTGRVSAISMEGAGNIEISKCQIHDCLNTGIGTSNAVSGLKIDSNKLSNIGGTGIYLAMQGVPGGVQTKDSYVGDSTITNNYIENVGTFYHAAGAIEILASKNNYVANNTVKGSGRFGIRIGGSYSREALIGQTIEGELVTAENVDEFRRSYGNVVEFNDISDCMTDSQDGGALYTYSTYGNVLRYNRIHDMSNGYVGHSSYAFGIHLDGNSDGNLVYGNTVDNLGSDIGAYIRAVLHVNGSDNEIQNNIFANNQLNENDSVGTVDLYSIAKNNDFQKNVVYNSGLNIIESYYSDAIESSDKNIYGADNGSISFRITSPEKEMSFEQWQAMGFDANSMNSIPGFIDGANGDFRFSKDGKAHSMGINEVLRQNIGVTADYPFSESADYEKLFVKSEKDDKNSGVITVFKGEDVRISGLVRNEKGFVERNADISFATDDTDIISVSRDGLIHPLTAGAAKITASAGNLNTEIFVEVKDSRIRFENAEGKEIGSIKGESFVKGIIDISDMPDADIKPMMAIYDSGRFVYVQSEYSVSDNKIYISIDLTGIKESFDELRLFCWEDFTLTPLYKSEQLVK